MDVRASEPDDLHARAYAMPANADVGFRPFATVSHAEFEALRHVIETLVAADYQEQIEALRQSLAEVQLALLELAGERWPSIAPERLRKPMLHEPTVTLRRKVAAGDLRRSA